MNIRRRPSFVAAVVLLVAASKAGAQDVPAGSLLQLVRPEGPSAPPLVVTLSDALERAKENDAQFRSITADAEIAREDRSQTKSSAIPALSHTTQYLGTQSNDVTPSGRFVTNDGVHVFRSWAVLRGEISAKTLSKAPYRRAEAAEALANARVDVAQRGLAVTVTKSYYALVTAERRYATAQQAADQARRFLDISQQRQRLGEVARSDVVKAEIQYQQQQQSYQEALLAMENARLSLAVLLFPTLNENFTVVDDLSSAPALPPFSEARAMAARENPDLRVAMAELSVAHQEVAVAQHAFLPSIAVDAVYGIEANRFALHSVADGFPDAGVLPNLGYFVTANLTVPIWDWGGLRSKVRQAETRKRLAAVGLSQAQRQLLASLYSLYNEALTAKAAVDNVRRVADLAAESLRLTNLRYEAGESTALEVVDAQNTLVQARNAYDEAGNRYRVAVATLQTVTGSF
jgi:outer membrane protein TolC